MGINGEKYWKVDFFIVCKFVSMRVLEIGGGNWGRKRGRDLFVVAYLVNRDVRFFFRMEGFVFLNWGIVSFFFG